MTHVNQAIKQWMTPYYQRLGTRVNFPRLMQAANVKMRDLPRLTRYTDGNGRNGLCYNHIMGDCPFMDRCYKIRGHVARNDVPEDFTQHLIRVLCPGMEWIMRQAGDYRQG